MWECGREAGVKLGGGGAPEQEASQSKDQEENLVLTFDCGMLAAVCG